MATGQLTKVVEQLRRAVQAQDPLSDGRLLGAFIDRGDEAAFSAIVRRHGPMVMGVCRRVLRQPHDVDDAFQATFLVLVRKAAAIAVPEQLGNWLYGVAYKTALKARTLTVRRAAREKQVAEMPEVPATPAPMNDLRSLLDQELSRLPERYRVPIVLCDLEGKTRKEVAEQLAWPEGTVSGRLARARELLAKRLARHGLTLSAGGVAHMLAETTASAAPVLLSEAVRNACLLAAGNPAGTISPSVAALTQGVIQAMLYAKVKVFAAALLTIGCLAWLGGGYLGQRAQAENAVSEAVLVAQGRDGKTDPAAPAVSARVAEVFNDGKTIVLEIPAKERGQEPTRQTIKLTDKTEVAFFAVGVDGAKPAVDQQAQVWFQAGSSEVPAKAHFTQVDRSRGGRSFISAKVSAVAADGKSITLEIPQGRDPNAEKKMIEIKMNEQTKLTYSYVPKDGAKPTVGYQAEVWLDAETRDGPAVKIHFSDVNKRREANLTGKIVGVNGNRLTLEVPSANRGEAPQKVDIKLTISTDIKFYGVGPNEAQLKEGLGAQVFLESDSQNTAAVIVIRKAGPRGR